MCGRYAAARDTATLVTEFEVEQVIDPAPAPSYNVAPTDQVAVVVDRQVEAGTVQRQLRTARWGLVPSWAKDPAIGSRMINARWEQAADKPAFRSALARRRCLLPADGYFEWYSPPHPEGGKPRKQPYYIHRADGASLAIAGLFEFWRPDPDAPWLVTATVLTIDAVGPMRALHDRMPLILPDSAFAQWLDPTAALPPGFDERLPVDLLQAHPVSTAVNSVRNDSADLIEPIPAAEDSRGGQP